VSTRNWEEIQ